jgi:hypothetical protein
MDDEGYVHLSEEPGMGIGKCTAATLGERGAKIVVADINKEVEKYS